MVYFVYSQCVCVAVEANFICSEISICIIPLEVMGCYAGPTNRDEQQ